MEEKQPWEHRLEHLQQAVAQLEVDRSRLQHHNIQLRTTLEQVTAILSSLLRLQWTRSLLLALPSEQELVHYSPRAKFGLLPVSENKVLWGYSQAPSFMYCVQLLAGYDNGVE